MAAFVVKAKKGAIVRAACALASEKVDALACGTAVTVAETVETNGGLRCRLAAPVAGWCSLKVLEAVEAALEPIALASDASLNVTDRSAEAAPPLARVSWEMKHYQKRCGALLRELDEGTAGASRDQLFDHLVVQHIGERDRPFQRFEAIPLETYDSRDAGVPANDAKNKRAKP